MVVLGLRLRAMSAIIRGEISLSIFDFGKSGAPRKPGFGFLGWNFGDVWQSWQFWQSLVALCLFPYIEV